MELGHEFTHPVRTRVKIVLQEDLLIHAVRFITKPLEDLEALPVELDLLTHLAQFSRELFHPSRGGWAGG